MRFFTSKESHVLSFSSCKTEIFVRFAVHGMRSVLRQTHILKASTRLLSLSSTDQASAPYIYVGRLEKPMHAQVSFCVKRGALPDFLQLDTRLDP